jgi:hypothetical protein
MRWVIFAPHVRRSRAASDDDPTIFEHFEWVAGVMARMNRRAGQPTVEGFLSSEREGRISGYRDMLRVEEPGVLRGPQQQLHADRPGPLAEHSGGPVRG